MGRLWVRLENAYSRIAQEETDPVLQSKVNATIGSSHTQARPIGPDHLP